MWKVLARHLLRACFLLGLISLVAFTLSLQVPGDVVLDYISIEERGFNTAVDPNEQRQAYTRVASRRGLDLPVFYLSITKPEYPAALERILPVGDRKALRSWIDQTGQADVALRLHHVLRELLSYSCPVADTHPDLDRTCKLTHRALIATGIDGLKAPIGELPAFTFSPDIRQRIAESQILVAKLDHHQHVQPALIQWPAVRWNGLHNQYHQWISGLVFFKPLISLVDGRNAWTKIGEALKWTLLMNGLALILAFGLGIGIGVWSGKRHGTRREQLVNMVLFILFALPSFWLATLLITFLSAGDWLSIFPSGGLGPYQRAGSVFEKWGIILWHLVLPVTCMALGALAYVSRQMKQSVVHQYEQPYVRSFRAQGISERTILRKHIVPNALFPIITLVGNSVPALLSGSLLMEVIFSIPGMGRLLYNSLLARDWPVVFPLLMLAATVTILSYVLTDFLYKWMDPRVKTATA